MVSAADRDAEELIQRLLREARPDDGLLGEEGARARGQSGRRWIVDPLDGTTNFLYRFPAWAVSIALEDADGMAVGVVFDPARDEVFSAVRGDGAFVNDEQLLVRDSPGLETALVATGFGYDADRRALQGRVVASLLPQVRDIRRAGAAALDIVWVAAGRLDAYYERGVNLWDWAAARLIAEEAGIRVADLERDPHGLAAAHPDLLPDLLDAIAEAESGVF